MKKIITKHDPASALRRSKELLQPKPRKNARGVKTIVSPKTRAELLSLREYQLPVFQDNSTGLLVLHWSRQIGKSFVLAAWAVQRLMDRPGRLITVLSNSRENGAEFLAKCAEVCRLWERQHETVDESLTLHFAAMRMELRILDDGKIGRIKVLAANARTARGFSGDLILDEFAFHEDSAAIWEAVEPILASNPDYLCRIASTGNGKHNVFYQMAAAAPPSSKFNVQSSKSESGSAPASGADEGAPPERFAEGDLTFNNKSAPSIMLVKEGSRGLSPHPALPKTGAPNFKPETLNIELGEAPLPIRESEMGSAPASGADEGASPEQSAQKDLAFNNESAPSIMLVKEGSRGLSPHLGPPSAGSSEPSTLNQQPSSPFRVSRVPRSLAWKLGAKIYDPGTRQEITPEQARERALDKHAYDQNYECVFADESLTLLSYELISAAECEGVGEICELNWSPSALAMLREANAPLYAGFDVARKGDLSVITVVEKRENIFYVRAILRMRNLRLPEQQERLGKICELPQFQRVAIDMTGLGLGLFEYAQLAFGSRKIQGVNFATSVPATRAIVEEGRRGQTVRVTEALALELLRMYEARRLRQPADARLRDDLRKPERVTSPGGRVSIAATRDEAGHADHFWSLALALEAAATARPRRPALQMFPPEPASVWDRRKLLI